MPETIEHLYEVAGIDKASPEIVNRQLEVLKANCEAVTNVFIDQTATIELLVVLEKKASDSGDHDKAKEYKKRKEALLDEAAANASTVAETKKAITKLTESLPK